MLKPYKSKFKPTFEERRISYIIHPINNESFMVLTSYYKTFEITVIAINYKLSYIAPTISKSLQTIRKDPNVEIMYEKIIEEYKKKLGTLKLLKNPPIRNIEEEVS